MKCLELSGHVRLVTIAVIILILISVNIIWCSLVMALITRNRKSVQKLWVKRNIIIEGI